MKSTFLNRIPLVSFILIYFCSVHGVSSLHCFECSSLDDNYCPEMMESDDESIVPYNSCSYIHEGAYCVKTIGVHGVHGVSSLHCFECSSLDDNYCPEMMESDDESIVPYNSCSYIHEGAYCVKTIGVHGVLAEGIRCYRCDETRDPDLRCTDLLFSAPLLSCEDVFEARYCIKATGLYEGSLGTRRFCSSRDMGNYCEHIKRPGDQLEYRSCVYTCTGNGCNPANPLTPSKSILLASILTLQISFLISLL